jgi:hypothetical protein
VSLTTQTNSVFGDKHFGSSNSKIYCQCRYTQENLTQRTYDQNFQVNLQLNNEELLGINISASIQYNKSRSRIVRVEEECLLAWSTCMVHDSLQSHDFPFRARLHSGIFHRILHGTKLIRQMLGGTI